MQTTDQDNRIRGAALGTSALLISGRAAVATAEGFALDSVIFGALVRAYRERREWSQTDLAKRLKIGQTDVSGLETGRKVPSLFVFVRLAEIMELQAAQLFDHMLAATKRVAHAAKLLGIEKLTPDEARPLAALLFGRSIFEGGA